MRRTIIFFIYLNEYEDFTAFLKEKEFVFKTIAGIDKGLVRIDISFDDMDKMVYLFGDWFNGGLGQVKFNYANAKGEIQHKTLICGGGGGYNETEYMLNHSLSVEILDRSPSAFIKKSDHNITFKGKKFLTLGYFFSGNHAQYKSKHYTMWWRDS